MANRIHILPDEIANRIAAGEVVERPASVVKELVENAVDASAERITIELIAGGKESIRVSDDGCGMSRDDGLLALERHATSKITHLSDLKSLHTHGFRGEALPSIASVSRMTVETRPDEDLEGTRIVVEGGRVRDVASTGRGRGTSVVVHGLFFNVPARRKFLKGADTEFRHVVNTVTAMALAYPDIAFRLSHSGRSVLSFDRSDRERRIEAIFGIKMGEDAVFVDGEDEGIRVWGSVGKPEAARKSGAQQILIVNNRWIVHKAMTYAVYDGYGGLLPKGLVPSFCLFLDIDPARLDVNVHPSKREVRFADERSVYRTVAATVSNTLRKADLIPELAGAGSLADMPRPAPIQIGEQGRQPSGNVAEQAHQPYLPEPLGLGSEPQMALPLTVKPSFRKTAPDAGPSALDREALAEEDLAQVSVWQLHGKYILAHIKNGMIIIDQQVAHQRILYEKALDQFRAHPGTGQRLLFPLTLDFGLKEIQVVREAMPLLERMGFGIRDFGGNTVVADAIPVGLKVWEDGKLLGDIVADLVEGERRTSVPPGQQNRQISGREHRLAASYAWHTSIRSGDPLTRNEMQGLIDQLFATQEPFVGPYGRPVLVKMSLDEIEHRFGR